MSDPQSMMKTEAVDTRPGSIRGADHDRWDREFNFLKKHMEGGNPISLADAVLSDFRHFEALLDAEEIRLIADPLLWKDEDLALGRWIEASYYTLSRCALRLLNRLLDGTTKLPEGLEDFPARLAAVALAAAGSTIKWAQIADAGRRPLLIKEVDVVVALIEEKGIANTLTEVPVHTESVTVPAIPLYVRVLLLDALCHGGLRRQHAGVIDSWLWEWISSYPLVAGPVEGPHLRAGAAVRGAAGQPEVQRVVSLEAMKGHLELATRWFQEGRIYPGHGIAAAMRVEDHVSSIDILRCFLLAAQQKGAPRQKREDRMEAVDVFVGLPEIVEKGFLVSSVTDEIDAPTRPVASGVAGDPMARIGSQYERPNRLMDLVDESPSGIGLEFDDSATPIDPGTLVGVRTDLTRPVVICEVVRRLAAPGRRSRLGTRVLTGEKRLVRLNSAKWPNGIDAVFIAGSDPSGKGDLLLISGTASDPDIVYEVSIANQTYTLHLSRVKRRGPGWSLAAMEFLEVSQGGGKKPGLSLR